MRIDSGYRPSRSRVNVSAESYDGPSSPSPSTPLADTPKQLPSFLPATPGPTKKSEIPPKTPELAAPSTAKPAEKVEVTPAVDPNDPAVRYRLITISTYGGAQRAFIKDQMTGETKLMKVGESIGDCKLIAIMLSTNSVRLRPSEGDVVTIRKK